MVEWRSHLGKVGEVFTDAAASVHGGGGQEETAAAVLYDVYDVLSW
jgi:homoserine dehydrogenase